MKDFDYQNTPIKLLTLGIVRFRGFDGCSIPLCA